MKFGIFYELQLPRPWGPDSELNLYHNALDHLTRRQRAGGIVPAVGAYGHAPLSQTIRSCCDRRTGGLLHLRPPRRGHR